MAQAISTKELNNRAVTAVASQYSSKADPIAYARDLLAKAPQIWAYDIALDGLRSDGFKVTEARKDAIWSALGGQ